MLWEGYRLLLCATVLAVAAVGWLVLRRFRGYAAAARPWPVSRVLLLWPLVVIILFVMVRSSFQHRPANISSFAFCDDAMVNSLVANSAYTVLSAVYGIRNEERSSEIYGALPDDEMIRQVRMTMSVPAADFVSDELPTLRRQIASVRRERPVQSRHRSGGKPRRRIRGAPGRAAHCAEPERTRGRRNLVQPPVCDGHTLGTRHRSRDRRISAHARSQRGEAVQVSAGFFYAGDIAPRQGLSQRVHLRRRIAFRQHARFLSGQRISAGRRSERLSSAEVRRQLGRVRRGTFSTRPTSGSRPCTRLASPSSC